VIDDDWGLRDVSPGDQNWARFESAIIPVDPYVDIAVSPSPRHDAEHCTMTMACALFKNWSHTKSRRARLDVYFDALPADAERCADVSIINRELYEPEIIAAIPIEVRQRIIRRYFEEIEQAIA
jgi:hypothetical protein